MIKIEDVGLLSYETNFPECYVCKPSPLIWLAYRAESVSVQLRELQNLATTHMVVCAFCDMFLSFKPQGYENANMAGERESNDTSDSTSTRRKFLTGFSLATAGALAGCEGVIRSLPGAPDTPVDQGGTPTSGGTAGGDPRNSITVSGYVRQNSDLKWASSQITVKNSSSKRVLGGRVNVDHPSYAMEYDIYNVPVDSSKKYEKDQEKLNTNEIQRSEGADPIWLYYEDRNQTRFEQKMGVAVNSDSIAAQYRVETINPSDNELIISFALPNALSISADNIVRIGDAQSPDISNGRVTMDLADIVSIPSPLDPNTYAVNSEHQANVVGSTSEETVHLYPPSFNNIEISDVNVDIDTSSAPHRITQVDANVSMEGQHSIHNPKIVLSMTATPERTFYPTDAFNTASSNAGPLAKTNVLPESAIPDKFAETEINESGTVSISTDRSVPLPIDDARRVTVLFCVGDVPVAYKDSAELSTLV